MDSLTDRVSSLPSGPALVSVLKAVTLPAPEKEALASRVEAVLADAVAAVGAFLCILSFIERDDVGVGRRGRPAISTHAWDGTLNGASVRSAHRVRLFHPHSPARPCIGGLARAIFISHHLSPPNTAAAGKENGGAPTPPTATATPAALTTDLATADCVLPGLTLTHPRATFTAAFYVADRTLVLSTTFKAPGASTATPRELAIPASAITSIAVIEDVPEDAGAVLMLVAVKHGVGGAPLVWGKAPLPTLALRLPSGAASDVGWGKSADAPRLAGHTAVVLCQALGRLGVPPGAFDAPSPAIFRAAASTAGGGCAVGAAVGAHQGYAFPLARGLAFVGRPPALVTMAGIWRAVLGRARGGGSASFDLILIPKKRGGGQGGGNPAAAAAAGAAAGAPNRKVKPLEFSSLPKAELGAVQAWLGELGVGVVLAGDEGAAAAGEAEGGEGEEGEGAEEARGAAAEAGDDDDEDGSSEEDSDFVPGSPSSDGDRSDVTDEEGGGGTGRKQGDGDDEDGSESGSGSGSDDDDDDAGSGSASLGSGEEESEGGKRAAKRAR